MIRFVEHKDIDINSVYEILSDARNSNQYTNNGPTKRSLERELESVLKIPSEKRVVCLSNGTHALHSLMYAYGAKKWATSAFTFPSSLVSGAFDVDILDIDIETGSIEKAPDKLKNYDGIILTNLFGSYVDVEWWESFCSDSGKILIFDNASSPLSTCGDKSICVFGSASFGSLHHTKSLGFGEGGFVVVSGDMYDVISRVSNFGFDSNREYSERSSNFKMSDISAAFILSYARGYNVDRHLSVQRKVVDGISKIDGVKVFNYKDGTIYGNLPVIFSDSKKIEDFSDFDIEVKKYYKPLLQLKNSLELYSKIINFPLYGSLSDNDVEYILMCIGEMR